MFLLRKIEKGQIQGTFPGRNPLTRKCTVDPTDPGGSCVECKHRRRGATCDRSIKVVPPPTRLSQQRQEHGDLREGYERLKNDVDGMKVSFDDFKTTVLNSLASIHQSLTVLLPESNPSPFPPDSTFLHEGYHQVISGLTDSQRHRRLWRSATKFWVPGA